MMEQKPVAQVKWGEWIGEGWQLFVARWQVWVPMMLVFVFTLLVPMLPVYLLVIGMNVAAEGDLEVTLPAVVPLLAVAGGLVTFALSGVMLGGVYRAAFKEMRGEPISVRDLFSGGDIFLPVLGALFLMALCINVGTLFCILPGFLMLGLFFFTIPLIVDKKLGVIEAMQRSFALTRPNMWMFMLFALVLGLLAASGQLACLVGWLATYPLQFLVTAVAYRDCFGLVGARPLASLSAPGFAPPAYQQQPAWAPSPSAPRPLPPTQVVPPPAAPPAEPAGSTVCPHCQAVLQRAANFCNFCGKPLRPAGQ